MKVHEGRTGNPRLYSIDLRAIKNAAFKLACGLECSYNGITSEGDEAIAVIPHWSAHGGTSVVAEGRQRHDRVKQLFLAALPRSDGERAAFLAQHCADEPQLQAEVESLLVHHLEAEAGGFLAPPDPPRATSDVDSISLKDKPTLPDVHVHAPASPSTPFPQHLGDYEILEQVGAGGMGQVFKARHQRLDRIVALKTLLQHGFASPASLARFRREVRAAARLQHANIVSVYDAREDQGVPYFVMEFVEGADLSSLNKQHGPLPGELAIACAVQAATGLAYAHRQGIVHRDIKPGNLLLDRHGVVKILDMGLARLVDPQAADVAGLTHSDQVMGTPDYMSPEQATDTKNVDARSDVYSLGCTLWAMLTGRPMYQGETVLARMMAHAQQSVPSLCAARKDVPRELESVFQKMVAKRPQDRFQSMDEVIAALVSCFDKTAPSPSAGLRSTQMQDEPPEAFALCIELGRSAVGVTKGPRVGHFGAENFADVSVVESRRPKRSHPSRRSAVLVVAGIACFLLVVAGVTGVLYLVGALNSENRLPQQELDGTNRQGAAVAADVLPVETTITAGDIAHHFSFDGHARDLAGITVGTPRGMAKLDGQPRAGTASLRNVAVVGMFSGMQADSLSEALSAAEFTFAAWVYPRPLGEFAPIKSKHPGRVAAAEDESQERFKWELLIDRLTQSAISKHLRSKPGSVPFNQWSHVAVVRQDDRHGLFVNGEIAATGQIDLPAIVRFSLGGAQDSGREFDGLIDEVTVFNRALANEEIRQLHQSAQLATQLLLGHDERLEQYNRPLAYEPLDRAPWFYMLYGKEDGNYGQGIDITGGVLKLNKNSLVVRNIPAQNMLIRSKVRIESGRKAGLRLRIAQEAASEPAPGDESSDAPALPESHETAYEAWLDANGEVGISKLGPQRSDLATGQLEFVPWRDEDGFIEFAFAAINDTLIFYVDGREVLKTSDFSLPRGLPAFASNGGRSFFKDLQVKNLDGVAFAAD